MTDNQTVAARRPTHQAYWTGDLFERGLGYVLVARFKGGGERVEVGVFLLDIYCLGVKNAMFEACEKLEYERRIRGYYEERHALLEVEPSRARDLVEQAARYARSLGFEPHPDCKKASRVFGGIQPPQHPEPFVFGQKGKPLYIRGPHESMAVARRIVGILAARLGEGNFDYLVGIQDPGGEDESGV